MLEPTRHQFTVEEYHQMARAGILAEDARVELIDGEIIDMAAIGDRHAHSVRRLTHLFTARLPGRAIVSVQNPIHLGPRSELQPDIALLRPRADFYASHPAPEDVLLLVEVAETSSRFDRRVKVPRYARSGVPECWLADLNKETVTVYRDPAPSGYRTVQTVRWGETPTPLAFPDVEIAVDMLG